jgi:hypothetical protein
MRRLLTAAALVVPLTFAGSTAVAASPGPPQVTARMLTTTTQTETAPPKDLVSKTDDQARQEASALNGLLDRSAKQRQKVAIATGQIDRCESLSSARQDLLNVAADRQSLVDALNAMDLSDLPDGETLRVDLGDAWNASADSDRNYASWAQQAQDAGCPPGGPAPRTSAHQAAQSTDRSASKSKKAFVTRWNPIASTFGLPERTARTI